MEIILKLTDLLPAEYKSLFDKAVVKSGNEAKLESAYKVMMANESRY